MIHSLPTLEEIQHQLQQELPLLQKEYRVATLALFGSYVRREQTDSSDLDILVTFTHTPDLLHVIELENYLSDQLGLQVDLVMRSALKPMLKQTILQEMMPV